MSVREVLARTDHRPWELPSRNWVMTQRWHDLLFAHWAVDVEVLRGLVPPELELDLFEGRAWIGVVPFRMTGVRLRGLPAVPGPGAFPELNVRTYVRAGGKAGVYFFSLDARSRVAVAVARRWFGLPYFRARMLLEEGADGGIRYRSVRDHAGAPPAELRMQYAPEGDVFRAQRGSLEEFLTERYCLFTVRDGVVFVGEVHHVPWPLQRARATVEVCSMTEASGVVLPEGEGHLLFARRLDVVVWGPVGIGGGGCRSSGGPGSVGGQ